MTLPKNLLPVLNIHCFKGGNLRRIFSASVGHRQRRLQRRLFTVGTIAGLSLIAHTVIYKPDGRADCVVRNREKFYFIKHAQSIGESHFHRLYRVTRHQFDVLCQLISPSLSRSQLRESEKATTVSVQVMLCVTLRIIAGANYLDVGWPYGIGTATTYHVFNQKYKALNEKLDSISFPQSEEECQQEEERFCQERKSPIHGVAAALDGIAIAIQQPRLTDTPDPRKYYNRKGFFAISVQAAVGANYKFLFVSARHAGSTHDSTAFRSTKLHDLISSNVIPKWAIIAADDAYQNSGHILTPYSGRRLSQSQDSFNFYLSSCRIAVEQAFGILVTRFGTFWSPLRFSLATDTLIILVACKLHNFIIDQSAHAGPLLSETAEENRVQGEPVVHLQDLLHTSQEFERNRSRSREQSSVRNRTAQRLTQLGFIRPFRRK